MLLTMINMWKRRLLLLSLSSLLIMSAVGDGSVDTHSKKHNNEAEEITDKSHAQRRVPPSPADRFLFLEDHITSLFTKGATILTMEEWEEHKKEGSGGKNADDEHVCGWGHWWLDQFENAAVVIRHSKDPNSSILPPASSSSLSRRSGGHNVEDPSFSSDVLNNIANDEDKPASGSSPSDINSFIVRHEPEKLFRTAFSMADFDRMLVTTTSIESCFDEINRQMRSSYCSGKKKKSHGSSSFASAHSVCPRECHPVFEVDELAMLSLYFKDKSALLLPPHQTQQQQPSSSSSQGVASHAVTHTNLCERPKNIGDACTLQYQKESSETISSSPSAASISSLSSSSSSSSSFQLSVFGSRHFLDSMILFIEYYYQKQPLPIDNHIDDDSSSGSKTAAAGAASASHYSSYSGRGSGGVNRQTFFNISSVLSECRARTNKLKSAKRKEGLRGAKLMGHSRGKKGKSAAGRQKKNDDHEVSHSESQQFSKSQLIELVQQISEVAISLQNRSNQNTEKENASALLLQSLLERLPTDLKEQYICFLKFFSDQPMFMPLTGAQIGSELWIMNIGAQRLAGLEKQLIPTPFGGVREPSSHNQNAFGTLLNSADGRTFFHVDESNDTSHDHKKLAKSLSVSKVTSAHIRATNMAPLRQMAHRTGKTLVVRDADGRHPFIRYLQLLVKQTLFGAEAAAVDVNAQLIYEPPPKVTGETLGSVRGASMSNKVKGEEETSPTLAQVRFSSQPPRYDAHDTILILLSKSSSHSDRTLPRHQHRHSSPFVTSSSSSSPSSQSSVFESVSSRLMVTLERSATHCHLPLKPCGKGGARGTGVGGKVEREFYSSNANQQQKSSGALATSSSSSSSSSSSADMMTTSVVTLDEAAIEMPTVTDSCLRPRIDYYTSPLIDSEAIIKGKIQTRSILANGDDDFADDEDNEGNDDHPLNDDYFYEYSLERERDPNIRRVFLDEPGDMLYIPRGMIYSYRTIRTLNHDHEDSERVAGELKNHHHLTSQGGGPQVVALDGALFLSLSIEPLTATHDASTFASLIQSQIREAFFEIEEGRERKQTSSSSSSSSSLSLKTLKDEEESHNFLLNEEQKTNSKNEKSKRKRKLDHCHDALNAVGGTTIIRQRDVHGGGEYKRVRGDKDNNSLMNKLNVSSPLRGQLSLKDLGIYSSSDEQEAGGGSESSTGQMSDNEVSDGGFMKIKRVKGGKVVSKEKDSSRLQTLPFPTECFNEAHFSLLIVEALQSSIPALRRAVIRIPSKAKLTTTAENKTKTECESRSNSLSPSSSSAYADALYARHMKWLHAIKTEMIRQFMTTAESKYATNSQNSESAALQDQEIIREEDPVLIQKRWVRLVLGKIFSENFLFEHSPLWFHESTPFQERLVNWGSSGGKRSGISTTRADLHVSGTTSSTTATTDSSDPAPNPKLKAKGSEKGIEDVAHFFMPRQCTMRAGDVIKLITSSAGVDVQELKLGEYTSSSAPHSYDGQATIFSSSSSGTFEKYKGYSVVSWKHNHALELASADLKAVVLGDIIIKNAMGTLLGETNRNEKAPHLLPRPWLSSIAHRKQKYRAGTQYWHEFNTIMAVSSPEDVNEVEDAFISSMP